MNDKTEYRSATWDKEQNGKISGYAVVFSSRTTIYKDQTTGIEYHEEIDPHALDEADMKDVVLRVNHEGKVLARTRNGSLSLAIDSKGLKIDADLTGSEESRNVYEAIKNGLYDKMSFAFTVSDDDFDNATKTRTIRRIDKLFDVAVVDFPAYEETQVSARAKFDGFASEDRKAFYHAENRKTLEQIENVIERHDLTGCSYEPIEGIELTERENIYKQMLEIRNRCINLDKNTDGLIGSEPMAAIADLEKQLADIQKKSQEARKAVLNGDGKTTRSFKDENRKDNKKMDYNQISDKFYDGLIEKRSAAGTSGMSNVIPVEIIDYAFRTGKNGILPLVNLTHIESAGNFKVPYFSDTSNTVSAHTENASITPSAFVPSVVTISHAEYQETLGYSYLGTKLATADLRRIVEDALMGAMNVKLDALAMGAVDALTWVTTAGATKNAVAWSTSGQPELIEILELMKLLPAQYNAGAKFFMSKSTMLSLLQISTTGETVAGNAFYTLSVLDGLTRLFGTQVIEDSSLTYGTIFYGDPAAVHMNIAGNVELANWLDRDSLTEKFQVACAAGAACEVGAFVKGANSFS